MRINYVLAAATLAFLLSGCSAGTIETDGNAEETLTEFPPSMA